jgi:hypothetical protein
MSALILFIGTIDDINDLKPNVRLTGHSLVAQAMAVVAENQLIWKYSLFRRRQDGDTVKSRNGNCDGWDH